MNLNGNNDVINSQAVRVALDVLRKNTAKNKISIPAINIQTNSDLNLDTFKIETRSSGINISAHNFRSAAFAIAWLADRAACGKIHKTSTTYEPQFPIRYVKTTAAMYDIRKPLYEYGKNGWLEQMDLPAPKLLDSEMENAVTRFKQMCDILLLQGFNGVMISDNIHIVTLDALDVYSKNSPARLRALKYLPHYEKMISYAKSLGLDICVYSDEIMASDEVFKWIGNPCPENKRVWTFLKAKYMEMFERFPAIDSVMVRMGEARGHLEYKSVMLRSHRCDKCRHRDEAYLHQKTCNELLSVICPNRKLFYRTWVAQPHTIHTDPAKYLETFGKMNDSRLVPVMKNTNGDFLLNKDINKTIGIGKLPQMVEFDCHRDYEGLHTIPTILAANSQKRINELKSKSNVIGIWVWPCESGYTPAAYKSFVNMTIKPDASNIKPYPVTYFRGFTKWTQANVYLLSRLAWNKKLNPQEILYDFCASEFGIKTAGPLSRALINSEQAALGTMYIDSYLKTAGEFGLNMPMVQAGILAKYPYSWIVFTNDLNINSLLLDIYKSCKDNLDKEINNGYSGLKLVEKMRTAIIKTQKHFDDSKMYEQVLHSFNHAVSAASLLATYRDSFLRYYKIAEMHHGPIWNARKGYPGKFKKRTIVPEEKIWKGELLAARASLAEFETALNNYRKNYDFMYTGQLDDFLDYAKGYINVVWLE